MSTSMLRICFPLLLVLAAPAQTWIGAPPRLDRVPGNAGLSMPGRWAQGALQVLFLESALPAELTGKRLHGLRLRRASFLGERAWGARVVTTQVGLGHGPLTSGTGELGDDLARNRPADFTLVAGPLVVSMPATPAPGPGTATAGVLWQLPFAQPFTFQGPRLFVEFVNSASAQDISGDHWSEGLFLAAERDDGVVLYAGNGGCGAALPLPMALEPAADVPPGFGRTFELKLRGGPVSQPAFVLLSAEPESGDLLPGLAFGAELSGFGAPGCHLWAAPSLVFPLTTGRAGELATSLVFPDLPAEYGRRIGVQVLARDPAANALGLVTSNGLVLAMNRFGIGAGIGSVLAPGPITATTRAPWPRVVGLAPVLFFDAR
jgi:hypothetical protein